MCTVIQLGNDFGFSEECSVIQIDSEAFATCYLHTQFTHQKPRKLHSNWGLCTFCLFWKKGLSLVFTQTRTTLQILDGHSPHFRDVQ